DTEFHRVRDGVTRSRDYCASRRKQRHGSSSSARSARGFYSVALRTLLRDTPCRACLPCTQSGTLAASRLPCRKGRGSVLYCRSLERGVENLQVDECWFGDDAAIRPQKRRLTQSRDEDV